jgi:hypothetical protein
MALNKHESQLADASDKPLIGARQAAIADVSVTGTYATDDTPIETAINSIIAALVAHGLIEEA